MLQFPSVSGTHSVAKHIPYRKHCRIFKVLPYCIALLHSAVQKLLRIIREEVSLSVDLMMPAYNGLL